MSRALITGAGGFVGPYLAKHLGILGHEVWGSYLSATRESDIPGVNRGVRIDVTDPEMVKRVVQEIEPDEIYHLAAISRPALGLASEYYDVNLYGVLNVLEAATKIDARVLIVSSAYAYGRHDDPITERTPLEPVNHYGASKAAGDLASIGPAMLGLRVVRVRPFNHTGPGQPPEFVLPTLVRQLVSIERGLAPPVLKIGNLDSVRDFCDVRDVVTAYSSLLERGESGAVYNIASGRGVSVRELVGMIGSLAKVPFKVEVEPVRVRANDIPFLVGDPSRAYRIADWKPSRKLERTVEDMIQAERASI